MSYLTEGQLRRAARQKETYKSLYLQRSESEAKLTIFLSHSHRDKELVLGLIALLASAGITLYVDWQDDTMPRITGRETAEKIKQRIEELDLFMVLATTSALASRWVPWEVGVADTRKPIDDIVIVPVVDPDGQFKGNEYLQLYQQISLSDNNELAVFPPQKMSGSYLKSWLLTRQLNKSIRELGTLS